MKGRTLTIIGIFSAVVAVILIICMDTIKLAGVTITCGILFVAVGLVNMLLNSASVRSESAAARAFTLIANAAAIVLGISMLVFQHTFTPMIAFMFALLVAVCALWQFFVLAVASRPYQLPVWLYIFPIILVAACVYIFIIKDNNDEPKLMLTSGIAYAILALACIIEGSTLGAARRSDKKAHQSQADAQTQHPTISPSQPESQEPTSTEVSNAGSTPKTGKIETTDDLDDEIKG